MDVKRFDAVDGLRGGLAVSVLLSHLVGSIIGWSENRPFVGAYISVVYFFIMSGFVLSYAHAKGNFIKYCLTRLARLWPLMFISTVLMVILYKYNQYHGGYVSSLDVFSPMVFLKNILFLHGVYWYDFKLINEPSWSISLEFWISLLIPLLFTRLNFIIKVIAATSVFIALLYFYRSGVPPNLLTAFVSMLIGSICYDLTKKIWFIELLKDKFFSIFVLFALAVCCIGVYGQTHNILDYFYIVAFIPLMFVDFLDPETIIYKILTYRFFIFLGYISFPLYLLHESVIISGFLYRRDSVFLAIVTGLTVSIFVAYIYARYVDFYLYKYLKGQIKKLPF
ncbi:acyltransferase family protein [Commensalibacter nepenthis]|uniref:Acyltransferase n=1 Tax=Commensalibacter nepenthis TaxID=3043872 RepID=A0ABT6Q9A1_9PROT|nr:acyltransferase [Commensalibacter sp. TBRC 10068]MDI2113483.1 acyltransferase [Commensalibacter sp. TBRC 10068]